MAPPVEETGLSSGHDIYIIYIYLHDDFVYGIHDLEVCKNHATAQNRLYAAWVYFPPGPLGQI